MNNDQLTIRNVKRQIFNIQLSILLIISLAAGRELEQKTKKSIIPKNIESELAIDGQSISKNLSFDDVYGDNNLPVGEMNKDNTPSIPTLLQTIEQTSNSNGAFPTPRFIYKGVVDSESELYLENPTEFINLIDSASTSSISPDDNGQFYVSQGYELLHRMIYMIDNVQHPQIELRFGADNVGLAYAYFNDPDTLIQVPFTVWDLNGTPDDNTDDTQLFPMIGSPYTDALGSWGIRDTIYSPWTANPAFESDWIYIHSFASFHDYSDLEAAWDYQVANGEVSPNLSFLFSQSTWLMRRITINSLESNPLTTINSINGLPRPAAGTIIRWNLNNGLNLYSANLLGFVGNELIYHTYTIGFPKPAVNLISGPPGLYLDGDAVVHWTPAVNDTGYNYFTLRASNDRGYVEKDFEVYVLLNRWNYKTHDNNNLTFSVFNCGISGKSTSEDIGDGMVWNDQNGIFSGDLVIGLSKTQASGRPYSNERTSDFYPLTDVRPAESPLPDFDQAFVSLYDDSQARNQNTGQSNPIGLQIIQNSYSKSTDPDRGFVILDYTIKNLNSDPLDSIFVGEHFDFDVGDYADNIADYNPSLKLAYAFESGGATNPGYYGITLLTGNVSGFTQNPSLYDEFLQYQDMYTIHTPPDTAADVRPFLSSGPYTIPAYGSIRVVFAAVAGNDLVQLNANTAAAHAIDLNLGEYNVTFQVDMNVQEAEGIFQPGSGDIVVFRSTPTGWTGEDYPLTDGDGDGIYEITVPFTQTPGFLLEYKFAIVPGDASPDWWEDFPYNREYTLTGAGEVLEPFWFSNDDIATIPTSQEVTVRFRVYMNEAHEIYHFSKLENLQSVWLNGEFVPLDTGGWSSFNVSDSSSLIRLYNDGLNGGDEYDGDEIWTAEVTFPPGTPNTMSYKYGAYADGVDTLNSGVNQLDNEAVVGNERLLIIDDSDPLFIPTVDIWKARTGGVPANVLTFQVDMSIQAQKKNFDPIKDEVQLRGDFNGWVGPESEKQVFEDLDNDSIYTITWPIDKPAGEITEYKFLIKKESLEEDWEQVETPGGNREFLLTGIPATLPVVYFSDDSINKTITFQVDMTVVMVRGQFNPEADSIIISGTVNGNPGSSPKFTDSGNNIFILSTEFEEEIGSVIDYKYVIKYASGDSTVENITANRSITILDIPQILAPVYFGDDDFVTVQQVQFVTDPVANDTSRFYTKQVTMEGLVMNGPREIYLNDRWGVFVIDPDNFPNDFTGVFVIQHDTTVTGTGFQNVKEGDIVSFTGYIDEFEGFTQFALLTDPVVPVELLSSGNPIPPPRIANSNHLGSTAAGEALEGMFVKVNNAVVVNNTAPNNKADMTDSFGENFYLDDYFAWFRDNINNTTYSWPSNSTELYVTGYVTDFFRIDNDEGYSLCPRFESDVVDASTVGPPQLATFINLDPVFTTIYVETEVNPGNDLTNVYFHFRWQGTWEEIMAEPTNLTGTNAITVYKTITSLPENTTFDIRAVAINSIGSDTTNIFQATTGTYPSSENQDITLNFPSHSNRDDYSTSDFRMFGLPGNPSKNLADLIDGTLGTQWIAFRDNGQPNAPFLVEYSSSTASQFSMGNGRAYWVLSMVPVSFTESAPTIPLNDWDEAEIPLQTGWNIITNPFTNDVPWEDVKESNTISGPIYGYSGTMNQPVTMLPYVGYYYFNEDGSTTLDIPYPGSTTKTNIDEQKLWQIVLSMTTEGQVEKLLTFGTATNSVAGMDQRDHRKPVAFDDQNGAYFIREEWDEEYSYFASDYRSEIKNVETWEFHVTAKRHEPVSLYFNDIDMIPEAHDVFLVDVNRMTYRDLRINNMYHYSSPKTENSFQLLAGNSDLLLEKLAEFVPTRFALENNFPNPFNPETTIPVEIPETRHITLTVYNVLGKKINTIYDGILEPGRHFLRWNGKNEQGTSMATGTYFYRLIVEGHGAHTGKMVLIK